MAACHMNALLKMCVIIDRVVCEEMFIWRCFPCQCFVKGKTVPILRLKDTNQKVLLCVCVCVYASLVELTEDILKHLMDLVVSLVCSGELSLARVLRKNVLDKVEQKKLLSYTNSMKTLAARSVAAR